jgi:hypothetical protein
VGESSPEVPVNQWRNLSVYARIDHRQGLRTESAEAVHGKYGVLQEDGGGELYRFTKRCSFSILEDL